MNSLAGTSMKLIRSSWVDEHDNLITDWLLHLDDGRRFIVKEPRAVRITRLPDHAIDVLSTLLADGSPLGVALDAAEALA